MSLLRWVGDGPVCVHLMLVSYECKFGSKFLTDFTNWTRDGLNGTKRRKNPTKTYISYLPRTSIYLYLNKTYLFNITIKDISAEIYLLILEKSKQ